MKKKAIRVLALALAIGVLCTTGCQDSGKTGQNSGEGSGGKDSVAVSGRYISDIYLDKGSYSPYEKATVTLELYNPEVETIKGEVNLKLTHISEVIQDITFDVEIAANENYTREVAFAVPETDFTGYAVEAYLYSNDKLVDYEMSAIDVSSDWSVFPRYGYLADSFGTSSYEESYEVLHELAKYHINGLFYFDVIDCHDTPLAGTVDEPADEYKNLARKTVKRETIQNLIEIADKMNMKNWAYNLMFGAYADYEERGISPEWGMYIDGKKQDVHPLPDAWETNSLKLFNPANKNWQDFFIGTHKDFFEVYEFDGFQVDSLGNRAYLGQTTDYKGEAFDLSLSYSEFLNRMYDELDVDIIFNAVSEYGQDDVLENFKDYDIIFAEIWTNGHPTYQSIKDVNDTYYAITEGKKGFVTPAYMDGGLVNKAEYFNEAGVRFTNSVIIATGGSHLELGDCGMLCTCYYADDYLEMTQSLERATRNTYSFMTAYENLLRGEGLKEVKRKTTLDGKATTTMDTPGNVWSFSKEKVTTNQEMLHLINLKDVADSNWEDTDGTKAEPVAMEDVKVKHYIEGVKNVLVASPDYHEGIMEQVEFETGKDLKGEYVEFTLPYLEYYTMVVFEK